MGRTVILVDDGLATGASMRAAVEALRGQRPVRVVVAIPAAPESTCRELKSGVDRVVRATTPSPFLDVGEAYGGLHPDQGRGGPRLAACGPVSHRVGRRGPSNVAVLRAGAMPEDEQFFAHENARTVKNAAEYYRATMFGGQVSSWNLRDRCMVETLDEPPRSAAG
ncbi:erythromycin esterase family protein [Streptomyces sp. NPDC001269]